MIDNNTVINGLGIIRSFFEIGQPSQSAIFDSYQNIIDGAIQLLKEQQNKEERKVKPVLDEQTGRIWLCGNCGTYVGFEDNDPHDPNEFDKYCRECGKPVLWEGR